jgi:iron complex outermembrane receptor protein
MRTQVLQQTAFVLAIAIGILGNTPAVSPAADLSASNTLISLNIKPQPLGAALDAFALQTQQQILFDPALVKGKATQGVQGTISLDMALAALLSGTGLAYSRSSGGAILVSQANPKVAPPPGERPNTSRSLAADQTLGDSELAEIVVTGTRRAGLIAADSPAPIQVLTSRALTQAGQPNLTQALVQNVPSLTTNENAFAVDTGELTYWVKLRGLNPNDVLVLVDGKRRHATANLAVDSGPYQGAAAADLNFIPVLAIDHIEVLQDGAAAQYGSDAIAGVVNIILRKSPDGGNAVVTGGAYFDGGGETYDVAVNKGFQPDNEDSYLNVTAEVRHHGRSDRSAIDPRVIDSAVIAANPNLLSAPGYPHLNHIDGDPLADLQIGSYNAGFKLGDSMNVYSFGTYGRKYASADANYRLPDVLPAIYPYGFTPTEELHEQDYAFTVGIKGMLFNGWRWDLSSTYGKDDDVIDIENSGNVSLFDAVGYTPTSFYAGALIASQWTTTFDVSRDISIGLSKPLNIAFGAERRRDTFKIDAGDVASRYEAGSQAYPGFALTDAGSHSRDNDAGYVDLAASPITNWQIDAAGRYEHYTDFGSATVGKLTSRYDLTPEFAIRGTASTGFRAPTLAEEYYSSTNVSPYYAFVQLPPDSRAARLIGIDALRPEKSTNFSVGVVTRPTAKLTATLDAYQITIRDRIVDSGSLFGTGGAINSPDVTTAIIASGNILDPTVSQTGANVFTNGLDTRTRGIDLSLQYPSIYSWGRLELSLAANYNDTAVTDIKPSPPQLAPQLLYNSTAISDLQTATPRERIVAGALWARNNMSINFHETLYGPSSELESPNGGAYYNTRIGTMPITDLELSYKVSSWSFAVGARNLFNRYPTGLNPALLTIYGKTLNTSAARYYPDFSPIGIDGGYYYARLSYGFF